MCVAPGVNLRDFLASPWAGVVGATTEGMCALVNYVEGPLRLPLLTVMVKSDFSVTLTC